jgi:hypothetical protein
MPRCVYRVYCVDDECTFIIMAPATGSDDDTFTAKAATAASFAGQFIF